jgi:predicted Fe-Mo cluster-binding NifX family protein
MTAQGEEKTIVALPVADGKLCAHFGHCQQFAFYEVDMQSRKILGSRQVEPPPHQPGLLPRWLHGGNAQVVIAGGMGFPIQQHAEEAGLDVVLTGTRPIDDAVAAYIAGTLDHDPGRAHAHGGDHHHH